MLKSESKFQFVNYTESQGNKLGAFCLNCENKSPFDNAPRIGIYQLEHNMFLFRFVFSQNRTRNHPLQTKQHPALWRGVCVKRNLHISRSWLFSSTWLTKKNCLKGTHFAIGFWAHRWNLAKIIVSLLVDSIRPQFSTCHHRKRSHAPSFSRLFFRPDEDICCPSNWTKMLFPYLQKHSLPYLNRVG